MNYNTDYWDMVDEIKKVLPKKIDRAYIEKMYETIPGVDSYTDLSRMGLCGQDVSDIDLSSLTQEEFAMLTFDENTIFSKEQIEKFHPDKILNDAKEYYENMDLLKKAGITGEGVNVVIIDSPFNHEIDEFEGIKYNDEHCNTDTKNDNCLHGNAVTSALRAISPDANITFCVREFDSEQENAEERHRQAALDYIQDIIDGKIKADVVSMSSSFFDDRFGDNKTEEVRKKLEAVGCTLIDSDTMTDKGFWYCNRTGNNPYIRESNNEITDEEFKEKVITGQEEIKNIEAIANQVRNTDKEKYEQCIGFIETIKKASQSKEEFEKYWNKRQLEKRQNLMYMISGGITITTNDNAGTKMYNGNGCNSWTIPQVAGLFSIAKQMDPNITYDEFCEVCKGTVKKENGLNMINPEGLVKEINERNIERAKNDERYAQIAKNSSDRIKKFDELKREKEYQKENPMIRERKPYNAEMQGNE